MHQSRLKKLEERYTPGQGVHRARHAVNRRLRGIYNVTTAARLRKPALLNIKELLDFPGGVAQSTDMAPWVPTVNLRRQLRKLAHWTKLGKYTPRAKRKGQDLRRWRRDGRLYIDQDGMPVKA